MRCVSILAALAGGAVLLAGCQPGGLSADSSCHDYLSASADEQYEAVNKIAADEHAANAVTPLGRPNIAYMCTGAPDMTLGDAVRKTG